MPVNKTPKNQATRILRITQLQSAVTQHVTAAIVLGGQSLSPQALSATLQAALQSQSDLDAARTVVSAKVKARTKAFAAATSLEALLHSWAEATFGPESPVLLDFGFTPAKPPAIPVQVKAKGAAKGVATRQAKKAALEAVASGASGHPAATTAPAGATPAGTAAPTGTPAATPSKA